MKAFQAFKTFWGTTKKCENKNLTYFFSSSGIRMGRVWMNYIIDLSEIVRIEKNISRMLFKT